jgi:hypothetical protein
MVRPAGYIKGNAMLKSIAAAINSTFVLCALRVLPIVQIMENRSAFAPLAARLSCATAASNPYHGLSRMVSSFNSAGEKYFFCDNTLVQNWAGISSYLSMGETVPRR